MVGVNQNLGLIPEHDVRAAVKLFPLVKLLQKQEISTCITLCYIWGEKYMKEFYGHGVTLLSSDVIFSFQGGSIYLESNFELGTDLPRILTAIV